MNNKKLFWRVNGEIRANELRVIGADDKQIGVLSRQDALKKAQELGLDLIEIAPKANPPVAKIIELGKFRYQEEKKAKEAQKKAKAAELKEIRFSPFIAENDYQTRLNRVKEFLEDGDKVKIVVVFKGRQMNSKQFGYDLIKRVTDKLGEAIVTDMEPKFLGRHLVTIISPVKKKLAVIKEENAKSENS